MHNKNKFGAYKKMKKLLLSLIICLTVPIIAESAFSRSDVGTRAAAFLKMPVGARAIGMGNAYTSVTDGASDMMYWNPAGLATILKKEISFMYSSSFEDIAYKWASFALPTPEYGVFGIAIQHLSYGDIDETDSLGNFTGNTFSPYEFAVYLSYAGSVFVEEYGIIDYGASFKYIYSIISASASAAAFDIGAIYTLNDETTSFGAVLQNVGTDIKYNRESESLPVMFKFGASKRFFDAFLLSADINFPSDNDVFPTMGAEYELKANEETNISLRLGYDGKQKNVPGFGGINAGFGARFKDWTFDYTFSPSGDLGESHRASLGIKFGYAVNEEKPEKEIKEKSKEREEISKPLPVAESIVPQVKSVQNETPAVGEEENDDFERYGFRSGVYEEEDEIIQVKEKTGIVAVMDLHSDKLPESEVNAFTQILRKSITENGSSKVLDKFEINRISPVVGALDEKSAKEIWKDSNADMIISGSVEKRSGKLHFNINIYKKNKQAENYEIVTEDSFRDVQKKMDSFVESFEKNQ